VKDIDDYFNLTNNIVCVNAIDFPLQDILSGCDYDSDTVLLIDHEHMLSISKKIFGQYRVCINEVTSSKKKYRVCNEDMAIIDNELSQSQKYIGRTVNIGQLCMSTYWDMLSDGRSRDELLELFKKVDVVTVLSGICIDLAKKMFEINIGKEIENVSKTKDLKKEKPLFWKYVSQNDNVNTASYNCPMDFLFEEMSTLDWADYRKDIDFKEFLVKSSVKDGDRKQQQKIFSYVENMCKKINNTYTSNLVEEERDRRIDDTIKYYKFYVDKLKVSSDTMYSLLLKLSSDKKAKIASRLLSVLYASHKDTFLLAFSVKNSTL
jgi:hemerythrin superfamily protein